MKNILFVCSANKQRSKTAEDYFKTHFPNFNFKSAGTNPKLCHQYQTTLLNNDLLNWADYIFVMEEKHQQIINDHTASSFNSQIIILGIEDIYQYYQAELIEILTDKMQVYLN